MSPRKLSGLSVLGDQKQKNRCIESIGIDTNGTFDELIHHLSADEERANDLSFEDASDGENTNDIRVCLSTFNGNKSKYILSLFVSHKHFALTWFVLVTLMRYWFLLHFI